MKKVVAFVLSVLSINASAAMISLDDATFGTDSITLHEETGLEWLDLTATQGRSVDDVLSQFDSGGDYYGFRHATFDEVITMQEGFGITYNLSSFDHAVAQQNASIPILANYIDYLGATFSPYDDHAAFGVAVGEIASHDRWFWNMYDANSSDTFDVETGYTHDIYFGNSRSLADIYSGQFLVRTDVSQVSEPSTFALLGLGVAGLGFARRKKA